MTVFSAVFGNPALRSSQILRRDLRGAMLLSLPLVVGRTATGQPFAMRDACPHRGMPFSDGSFDGDLLECCYHGWKFEPISGQCREIPSLLPDSKVKPKNLCQGVSRGRARRLPVGLHSQPGCSGRADAPAPRLPVFSEALQTYPPLRRSAPANVDSRYYRIDGPRPRALCAPGVVVAHRRSIGKRKRLSTRSPMVSAFVPTRPLQQRPLQTAGHLRQAHHPRKLNSCSPTCA